MGASLAEQRSRACRLDPAYALDEFSDAEAFLADRGMLTLTPSCSLPSLFEACHEEPHSPGKAGYGKYPKTRWWWGGALEAATGVVATKLHRGKTLFLTSHSAALVDPLCRAADPSTFAAIVEHLRAAGPTLGDDLKAELGYDAKTMQRAKRALESSGAVLTRHLEVDSANGGHRHVSEWYLWEQVVQPASHSVDEALVQLLVAGVEAAVVAPEREVRTWFSWKLTPEVVQRAVDSGLIHRVDNSLAVKE